MPDCLQALLEARKAFEHVFLALGVALAGQPDIEILQHGEIGKDAASLRHVADALARHLVRGAAREVGAVELDGAAAAPHQPHDGAQRRRLADAVASEQRGAFAGADLELHALEDVQLADMDVDVGEPKHGAASST